MDLRVASLALVALAACGGPPTSDGGDARNDVAPIDSTIDSPLVDARPDSAMDAPPDDAVTPTGPGTVVAGTPGVCPGGIGAPVGAMCTSLTVTCPSIEDIHAAVVVTEAVAPTAGTVVLLSGGGGTMLFNGGGGSDFVARLVAMHYRTVQVAWMNSWEQTGSSGIRAAACRPATVLQWVFDTVHTASRTEAYCAVGFSGGSGAISYALAHYGKKALLDYAMLISGPPFGRIDYGCNPSLYTGPALQPCSGVSVSNLSYGGAANMVGAWENTPSCGMPSPPAADVMRWASDSVVSTGADYNYPETDMSFWFCNQPNETGSLGAFYLDRIVRPPTRNCNAACTGEAAFTDTAVFNTMMAETAIHCVPHHLH